MDTVFFFRYNLQLFAKDGPGGEKTEPATEKKLEDARKEGQVAKSSEIINGIFLVALFATMKFICSFMGENFVNVFTSTYAKISTFSSTNGSEMNYVTLYNLSKDFVITFIKTCAPIMLGALAIGVIGNVAQVKWKITAKPLMPKFNKLNPISGFKRIFSKQSLINLLKSVGIVVISMVMVYQTFIGQKAELFNLYEVPLTQAIIIIGNSIFSIGLKISLFYLIIGIVDLIYQKRKFSQDMMMTKQEIKDEYKNEEGDPQVKGQIRNRMRQASQRRMMKSVPEADVVITNPTHFAVAIKYDSKVAEAPVVLAKGADYLAQKIKEIARENQIQIHENKPLARALYNSVEVGEQIPQELYQAVAEVLAVIYGAKEERR